MQKRNMWLVLIVLSIGLSGCKKDTLIHGDEHIATEGVVEKAFDATQPQYSEETEYLEESKEEKKAKEGEEIEKTERKEEQMEAAEKEYQVKQFTFKKANSELLPYGSSWIQGVYELQTQNGVLVIDATNGGPQAKHSLYIGQLLALFGNAHYTTESNEDLCSYVIEAKREDGVTVYLDAYYGPSGPAIGGNAEDEISRQAAKELEQLIITAKPVDYEIRSTYEDVGVSLKMGVKDGVPYYETIFPEDMTGFVGE